MVYRIQQFPNWEVSKMRYLGLDLHDYVAGIAVLLLAVSGQLIGPIQQDKDRTKLLVGIGFLLLGFLLVVALTLSSFYF